MYVLCRGDGDYEKRVPSGHQQVKADATTVDGILSGVATRHRPRPLHSALAEDEPPLIIPPGLSATRRLLEEDMIDTHSRAGLCHSG